MAMLAEAKARVAEAKVRALARAKVLSQGLARRPSTNTSLTSSFAPGMGAAEKRKMLFNRESTDGSSSRNADSSGGGSSGGSAVGNSVWSAKEIEGDTDGSQKAKFMRLMGARKGAKGGGSGLFGNAKLSAKVGGSASMSGSGVSNGSSNGSLSNGTAGGAAVPVPAPPAGQFQSGAGAGAGDGRSGPMPVAEGTSSNLLNSLERQHNAARQRQNSSYGAGRRAGLGAGY